MDMLLDRFCRYARIDTQADEKAATYPSSEGQLHLGRLLVEELRQIGLTDAAQDEHGIVMATVPATQAQPAPTVAWIAHVDTSPETSGRNVKPTVHRPREKSCDGLAVSTIGNEAAQSRASSRVIRPARWTFSFH
jgi:tripeptide aminopeptidase